MNQRRTEQILLSLKKLDFLSRSQIQTLHNLGGKRNANKILNQMSEYLHSFREGENVYYLSRAGREYVGSDKARKRTPQVKHFLMRNDAFIFFGRPSTWQTEIKVKDKESGVSIVPDAIFQRDKKHHFLEVDNMQKMNVNHYKIEKYRKLSLKISYTLIWVTTTDYRKKRLAVLCEGLQVQIYTIEEMR